VRCFQAPHIGRFDAMLRTTLQHLTERGLLESGDLIAVIGGVPVGKPGTTNILQVATVAELMQATQEEPARSHP
jgi:pyruvate kinase